MRSPIIPILVALLIAGGIWWYLVRVPAVQNTVASGTPAATSTTLGSSGLSLTTTPGEEVRYVNTTYHFSFQLPDGFRADEYPTNQPGIQAVIVQDSNGNGLELTIGKAAAAVAQLSAAVIAQQASGAADIQATTVADTPAFSFTVPDTSGGTDAELWFVHAGVLYQLLAPIADAPLIEFVRTRWSFQP